MEQAAAERPASTQGRGWQPCTAAAVALACPTTQRCCQQGRAEARGGCCCGWHGRWCRGVPASAELVPPSAARRHPACCCCCCPCPASCRMSSMHQISDLNTLRVPRDGGNAPCDVWDGMERHGGIQAAAMALYHHTHGAGDKPPCVSKSVLSSKHMHRTMPYCCTHTVAVICEPGGWHAKLCHSIVPMLCATCALPIPDENWHT